LTFLHKNEKKQNCYNRWNKQICLSFKKTVKLDMTLLFPNKNELNILDYKKIRSYLSKLKPKILIHLAGLSRPMKIHEDDIKKSIDLNIIGTANVTKACEGKKY
jgi:dTDP-4-dehydrorhamnose reductase